MKRPAALGIAALLALSGAPPAQAADPATIAELEAVSDCATILMAYLTAQDPPADPEITDLIQRADPAASRLGYRFEVLLKAVGDEEGFALAGQAMGRRTHQANDILSGPGGQTALLKAFAPEARACLTRAEALPARPAKAN